MAKSRADDQDLKRTSEENHWCEVAVAEGVVAETTEGEEFKCQAEVLGAKLRVICHEAFGWRRTMLKFMKLGIAGVQVVVGPIFLSIGVRGFGGMA
ncbi:hypothetical protein Droror1_Dr00025522 [Drosera rotundifolia]